MFQNEYRVVNDGYAGFEVQIRRWWFPIWLQVGINTHSSFEKAERFARDHARGFVRYLGRLGRNSA